MVFGGADAQMDAHEEFTMKTFEARVLQGVRLPPSDPRPRARVVGLELTHHTQNNLVSYFLC